MRRLVLPSLTGVLLTACSPAYDWRTVTDNVDAYTITLPAKPSEDERAVDIAGRQMRMHMRIAQAPGGVLFAVGVTELPSDDPAMQRAVLDFMLAGLARNVSAPGRVKTIEVRLASGGRVGGTELVATGAAGEKNERRVIHAWLAARGRRVYQATIVAQEAPPPEQAEQFFSSLELF